MLRSLFTAATGMMAQQQHIDVISNNLANVNTTGFKRGRADFQDLLYQTLSQPGAASSNQTEIPTGIQLGLGVRTAAVQRLFLEGDFQQTQNQLDICREFRRVSVGAVDYHPERCCQHHRWHRWHRLRVAGREYDAATGRPDPVGQFPQSCWPEWAGAQSLSENDGLRRSHHRGAQPGWSWWAVTGSARNFQCQRGGRNGQSHHGTAGV